MTGVVFTLAEGVLAPAARGFTCRFRPADGKGDLSRQIPLHPKAEPGQPALRAALRCSLFRGRGTTRPCGPQTRPAPDPGKPALLGGFQGDPVLTNSRVYQSVLKRLRLLRMPMPSQSPRSAVAGRVSTGGVFEGEARVAPRRCQQRASQGTPSKGRGDGAGAPWGCRGAWQDKPPDVPPGTPGMQTPRRRR